MFFFVCFLLAVEVCCFFGGDGGGGDGGLEHYFTSNCRKYENVHMTDISQNRLVFDFKLSVTNCMYIVCI